MARFLLSALLFTVVAAHPDWFTIPGLQQLISPSSSTGSSPLQVQPQQPQPQSPVYSPPQQLRQSYSPGYQAQAVQPAIQHAPVYAPQNRAYGIAQRPVAQPLPSSSQPLPPSSQTSNLAYPQQTAQAPTPLQYSYSSNQVNQQVAPSGSGSQDYWFKEGTPILPCGYGAGSNGIPLPQYNNPHKKCNPWHPMCGWLFTCIQDA